MKRAFTMIELVFVIVVLGILSAIAAPRIFATRDDAIITKARADIASIQSSIVNSRNTGMLSGKFEYPDLEDAADTSGRLFTNVLQGGIKAKGSNDNYGWTGGGSSYTFTSKMGSTTFTYDKDKGSFTCPNTSVVCKALTE